MLAGRKSLARTAPGEREKKLSKLCGIIAFNIAQNKEYTFIFRQMAEQILAEERVILGRKLVTGRYRQLFHHRFVGGMPGPVDKEIFYDLIKPGPALGRGHGLKHRFIINGFPESLLHQILSGGLILSHGGTPADQFVSEIPVKLFKHVTKYPFL